MIKLIRIDNFKSLVNFELTLAKFNCVVGLNGAGKSTLLQALDFLSELMRGDLRGWLDNRQWKASDLNSKLIKKGNIEFTIVVDITGQEVTWAGSFNRTTLRCTKETVTIAAQKILAVDDGHYQLDNNQRHEIIFEHQGSILSSLKETHLNTILQALKEQISAIRSLDLISPELLRSRTRSANGKLGLGGENMSALIHEKGVATKAQLYQKLVSVYPQLTEVQTKSLKSGWKQLEITERFGEKCLTSSARHMNDGMLRLMAILLQLDVGNSFQLFDEIENGINPELIECLMEHLVEAKDQVLVTTHSPMVLNFIDDAIARTGVICLYKTSEGHTKAIRLFDIPSMAKKLEFMGPGEAFIDTDLTQLHHEIADITSTGS